MFFLEFNGFAEEVQSHERGLAALPGKGDFRYLLGLDVLPDVFFEQVFGHAETAARVQVLLREEVAVLAIEIADGPPGFIIT